MGSFIACHDLPVTWGYIINAFFAASPNHILMKEICEKVLDAKLNTEDIHLQTGPRLFGSVLEKYPNKYFLLPIESFYRNIKGDRLIDGKIRNEDVEERYGNHFYAYTWKSTILLTQNKISQNLIIITS
jgi:hypothetical protein